MTTKEFMTTKEKYLLSLPSRGASERTVQNYSKVLSDFAEQLRRQKSEVINKMAVAEYRTAVIDRGANANTARQYIIDLSAFFAWAVKYGIAESNPCEGEIASKEEIRYDLLTAQEIEKIIKAPIRGKLSIRNKAIVLLLCQSGLRNSELRELSLSDLDFSYGILAVKNGKGGKSRIAPFPKQSREAVSEYLRTGIRPEGIGDEEPLFGTTADEHGHIGKTEWHSLTAQALNGIVRRYTSKIAGHEVHTHTLRHVAASLWDDMGVPLRQVQNALGHSSITTTEKIYVSVLNRSKAAEQISKIFE